MHPFEFPTHSFSDAPSFPRPSAVVEVYAEWAGRCNSLLPLLKRLKLEKDYDQAVFVMLHCKAEEHEMLEEYRGMSMPHFLVIRNGVKKATVNGANMPLIEKYIVDYTPNVPEADDLEENPLYIRRKEEQAEAAARAQEELRAAAA
jgi:thiol-disulfide isomerase/thioredoxin